MRPNSEKVLAFLQEHSDKEYTKQDLVEELDVPMAAVTGSVNGLVKKGLATERIEEYAPLVIRWIQITKEGLKFNPVQEERRLAREKAEATAARKAARAKEKAERARRNSVL